MLKKIENGVEVIMNDEEESALRKEWDSHAGEMTVKACIDKRRKEYGSFTDQFEFIVEFGIDAFIAKQQAIKLKYPKPA